MQLDELVSYFDSLWWATVIKGMERSNETYKWQQMMFKLAGRIQGIEQRARRSASKQGKDALVDAEAPPSTSQDEANMPTMMLLWPWLKDRPKPLRRPSRPNGKLGSRICVLARFGGLF
jgi:hypothetical protein